jgi:hypothetical protein
LVVLKLTDRLGRKEPNNDRYRINFHPKFEQVAWVDSNTGEFRETTDQHRKEAETLYRELAVQGISVRVAMEASGHAGWLERLLAVLRLELWTRDAAEIRGKRVRKQKMDGGDRFFGHQVTRVKLCYATFITSIRSERSVPTSRLLFIGESGVARPSSGRVMTRTRREKPGGRKSCCSVLICSDSL